VQSVRPHNQQAAAVWGAGGPDYDKISEHTSDAIEHLVRRVLPQPGERVLDIATGTGWTARRLAARGPDVVGIDLGASVIEVAKTLGPRSILGSAMPRLLNSKTKALMGPHPHLALCSPPARKTPQES
jgi:2-polyprenyl-3-methyl-5-hydroxy-6-metoxy-1,4-benzoquinol methylase